MQSKPFKTKTMSSANKSRPSTKDSRSLKQEELRDRNHPSLQSKYDEDEDDDVESGDEDGGETGTM